MPALSPGARFGHYEIRSKLGAGGMAEVFLAEDTRLGRRVALKLLPSEDQADTNARKRLEREARAAATLDHAHICAVYEVGEVDGLVFIAMQYVEGQTLAARLAKGPVALRETLAIAIQITDALADAHEHGILHRDIKPGNIMLTTRGQVKVMDFGLARIGRTDEAGPAEANTASILSAPGAVLGTVPYMSPEQVQGAQLDQRSDVFSAGIVLYEMVAGRGPFDESSAAATAAAILTREPLPLMRFATDVPPELERIVTKALRKDAELRYQTAKDLLVDLRTLSEEQAFQVRLERTAPSSDPHAAVETPRALPVERQRMPYVWAAGALALAVLVGGGWWLRQHLNARWARAELPKVAAFAEAGRNFEAYDLAISVEPYLSGDPTLSGLMPVVSDAISVTSDPPGAQVYLKRFIPDAKGVPPDRQRVGTTPLKNLRIARGEYVLSIELSGYASYERTVSGANMTSMNFTWASPAIQVAARLVEAGTVPPHMVFVPGSEYRMVSASRPTDLLAVLSDFFIDKYEVSNREYKEFIDAGGYVKREFWNQPVVKDGRRLEWDQAVALFVDRTGLPGPREWSNQNVPEGKEDYPVTGVSWYEAAAYAQFRGKQLPTVYQWEKAARDGIRPGAGVSFMPWGFFYPGDSLDQRANFGVGPLPVSTGEFGMSAFGAYNMAGNVAEWTMNESSDGYLATGGGWSNPAYTFAQFGGLPGLFSSNKLGFRLVKNTAGAIGDQGGARIEITREIPVYAPTAVAKFNQLAAGYRYEHTPLDARIEETIEMPDWTRQRVTFNGAGERATAYLYLPHHTSGPLQVLHYVPAGDVELGIGSLTNSIELWMTPFIKSGRAIVGVVLKGYVGRLRPAGYERPASTTVEYVDWMVQRVTDLRRGLDYLETRPDIDRSRMTFFGPSAGAQIGLILAAVEPRYRAVVLVGAGLPAGYIPYMAEANPINFASHIGAPKLLLHGRYDEDSPLARAGDPLFKLLSEPKERVLYEGGHVPPADLQLKTVNEWLDATMGRVVR